MEEFIKWGEKFGIDFSKIEIKKLENQGYGLLARNDIYYGEQLFAIPEEIILSLDKILGDEIIKDSLKSCNLAKKEKIDSLDLFLLFLSLHRFDEEFFWRIYFKNLPQKYGLPIFWDEKYKSCLPKAFQKLLSTERGLFEKRYSFANEICPFEIPEEDFKWAWSAFFTRNVKVSQAEYLKPAFEKNEWKRPAWLRNSDYDDSGLGFLEKRKS